MRFEGDQLQEVEGHVSTLQDQLGDLVKYFQMGDVDDGYEYDFDRVDIQSNNDDDETEEEEADDSKSDGDEKRVLVARYCLARQVLQCLKDNGRCYFYCEY